MGVFDTGGNPEVYDTARHVGGWVALLFLLVGSLGYLAAGVAGIVMAFLKRTRGWIAAGVVGAALLVLPDLGFFGCAAFKAMKGGAAQAPSSSSHVPPRPFTGGSVPYRIQLPGDWLVQRNHQAYDLWAHRNSLYLGVIADEGFFGDTDLRTAAIRRNLRDRATDAEWGPTEQVMLDGREWNRFWVKCTLKDIPIAFEYYVYGGPEGNYQIVGTTAQNLFARDRKTVEAVIETFHFPPAAPSDPAAPGAGEKPKGFVPTPPPLPADAAAT